MAGQYKDEEKAEFLEGEKGSQTISDVGEWKIPVGIFRGQIVQSTAGIYVELIHMNVNCKIRVFCVFNHK